MLTLSSPAFAEGTPIPDHLTCTGPNRSPALAWTGAPDGTKSFALIMDDPDAPDPEAPKMVWVHWVAYNIPASVASLPEGASGVSMPAGTREGLNDAHRPGYTGPCPPIGRHRYFHKLYALDTILPDLGADARKPDLEAAMAGHILAQATLMGTFDADARTRKHYE